MELTHEGHERRLGLMLAFGALIWTGTFNALAKGLTPYLSPMTLLLLSEALTATFIVMTFGLVPLMKELLRMDRSTFRICILYGLLNSALAPLFWFTGLKYTSAVNASILSSADVVAVLILSQIFLGEKMTRMQFYGLSTIVTGILVMNFLGAKEGVQAHLGDIFVLLGSFSAACGSVLFKKYLSHVMPELAIAIRNISAIIVISLIVIILRISVLDEVTAFPVHKVLLLLAFTFFSRYLNLAFFYEALQRLPATTLSLIQAATPLSGLTFAYLLLGETIYSNQILGCCFIICGLVIENLSPKNITLMNKLHLPFWPFHSSRKAKEPTIIPLLPRNV